MIKNIYEQLGFKRLQEGVYPDSVIDEARALFSELPLKNIMLRQLVIEPALFEETFAISTAEDSELTKKTAEKIALTAEIQERLEKYHTDKTLTSRQKYDQLEFENIKDIELNTTALSFQELSVDLVRNLHNDLTVGLDEYAHTLGISRYHSGQLRDSNSTKVGKIRQYIPPDHTATPTLLKSLFKEFSNRKKVRLTDILEFHILLYAIHPFANGNKRVCRIIESLLLNHYGYSAQRMLSMSTYYSKKKESCNFFIIESLRRREVDPFVNFALRGYFYVGITLFNKSLKKYVVSEYTREFANRLNALVAIDKKISDKKIEHYKKAGRVILEFSGMFTHKQFVDQMKRQYGCTLGVSQELLKILTREGFLRHRNRIYFIDKAPEINEFHKKITRFLVQNNIQVEE